MERLSSEIEDQIQDGKNHPWFCNLHNRQAEPMFGEWRCPECNDYIEKAWEENLETGEFSDRFPTLGSISDPK